VKSSYRRAAIGAAVGAIAALSGFAPAAQAQAANPFGSPTQFCQKHSAPAGTRNASSPGVTPSSITLVTANIDTVGLARLGVQLAPADRIWKALTDEINENCGGSNGRKLILKKALGNPLSADPVASTTANCIKATEDYKAFMVVNIQSSPPMARCVTFQHKAIGFVDGPGLHNTDDMAAANGRLLSVYPAGDKSAAAFLSYAFKHHTFKNKKVMVLGVQREPSSAADLNRDYIVPLKKQSVDAYLEVLPCVGAATNCKGQVGAVVSRAKSNGVDMILTSHLWTSGNIGVVIKNMFEQNLRAPLIGPTMGVIHSDSTLPGELAASGSAAARFISDLGMTAYATDDATINGAYRVGAKPTAFAKLCLDLVNKRLKNSPAWTYSEKYMNNNFWTVTTNVCRQLRAISRALYSLGNNVTTERAVVALAKETNQDKAETTPSMRDRIWYSKGNTTPQKTVPVRYSFPCPGAASPNTTPCMMPVDKPIRAFAL
jgi:hypothetical protein